MKIYQSNDECTSIHGSCVVVPWEKFIL